VSRIEPGDVAVISHEDLDRVAAEALVRAGVAAVVNAAPSISGRYPNLGPKILEEAGIPLVDGVGPLVLQKVREGEPVRLEDDRLFAGDRLIAVGIRQDRASILVRRWTSDSKASLGTRSSTCARNEICSSAAPASPSSVTPWRAGTRWSW
jgi:uncharacterized membrane-anchored protein